MSANEIPSINVPYPPELTVEEILGRRPNTKLRSRAPNSFIIYRLAYIKELKRIVGDNISMNKISRHISLSWSKEPSEIKAAYKELSGRVENRLIEMRQNNKNNTLEIVHENFSSSQPSVNNNRVDEMIFFDYYFDYYYIDLNYFCNNYYNFF
ncbi:hypothetical protein RclHR1_07630001 [Rhizophagus clarus]|uniref:Kinase-like domain-containing protein n=1 Tax=Rhizophagus clarus TaxID=94130 RepID=A0A2Z6S9C1_9GLOM|nr:hypothetical protein RclHR1_07630001 [Rhizophagus clarus]GES98134.1 kinase-like domain-containing protein [Rhizophagus clarus]